MDIKSNLTRNVRISNYINEQIAVLDRTTLWSSEWVKQCLQSTLSIVIPTMFLIFIADKYPVFLPNDLVNKSINEMLSINLWQLQGILGYIFFFLSTFFPNIKSISSVSSKLLISTYYIGITNIGVICGQFLVESFRIPSYNATIILKAVWILSMVVVAFLLNFTTLYLGSLITHYKNDDGFLVRIKLMKPNFRRAISLFCILIFILSAYV